MRRLLWLVVLLAWGLSVKSQQHHDDALDDILQHVPMASVFALKAVGYHAESSADWTELGLTAAGAYLMGAAVTYSAKQLVSERRPDKSNSRSFPSGHATFAFAGATMLHHEFGHLSPWVSVGGFGLATLIAASRVAGDRHYLHDVCAGAAIGVAATELSYFLKQQLLKSDNMEIVFTGQTLELAVRW